MATGKDIAGNEKTETIPFSVRNWGVLELLPSTENNKTGRTMPVKFSLRVVQEVDPAQPFVYSEELTITIYEAGKLTPLLQSSTFGSDARDYRINAAQQTYITNFQTLKKPMQYTVEILRNALSIGTFGGRVTVSPSPSGGTVSCLSSCSFTYAGGTAVSLTAQPNAGHIFVGWDGACGAQGNPCTLVHSSDESVSAYYCAEGDPCF